MSLLTTLRRAAAGAFPATDGTVDVTPAPAGPVDAVVAFTAHSVIAADVSPAWVSEHLPTDNLTGPMRPDFLAALGDELGVAPGSVDLVLAAAAVEPGSSAGLVETASDGARSRRARTYRTDVRTYGDRHGHGTINIGRGLAGRWEVSVEITPPHQVRGYGATLVAHARRLIPAGDFVFASVAPGNARSVRAFLAAGFVPIGSEVLFLTRPLS